ncbi:aromatic amino acid lyase, partial [Staphylococcus pseudintermedius]|uniref:aromatic amino acid lyase n=1 Tax=Staphylococcus pseudintermedius TaxID=283734 RepID=UPI001F4E9C55
MLRAYLHDSALLAARAGSRTQDALSLRAIPHYHGAVRDLFGEVEAVVARALASATDNPVLSGTPAAPRVHMGAPAVGVALGIALGQLAIAAA